MNRIVREHYPVSKLPEDLRKEFPGQEEVTLTLEVPSSETSSDQFNSRAGDPSNYPELRRTGVRGGNLSRLKHFRRSNYKTIDEINDYVGSLRDEWAHRER